MPLLFSLFKAYYYLQAKIAEELVSIDGKKIPATYQTSSLYDYLLTIHKIDKSQAYRLSIATRVIIRHPPILLAIKKGTISFDELLKIEKKWQREKCHDQEKQWTELQEYLSQDQYNRALSLTVDAHHVQDYIQRKNDSILRAHLSLEQSTVNKLHKLKGLLYNRGNHTFDQLLNTISTFALDEFDPEHNENKKYHAGAHSRFIPEGLRTQIWKRAKGMCENCGSNFALEIDHVIPFARGGTNDLWNLRLLCRNCNARSSIECFGTRVTGERESPHESKGIP